MQNMRDTFRAVVALIFTSVMATAPAFAGTGESIVFDPATGNYKITHYSAIENKFETVIFIPATKINPVFNSKFTLDEDWITRYKYTLISGRDSQQVIRRVLFDPVSSVTTGMPDIPLGAPFGQIAMDMMAAAKYFGTAARWSATMGYSASGTAFRTGWYYDSDTGGLAPGGKAVFSFRSRDLPGLIQSEVEGYAPESQEIAGEELPDEEDGGFGQQYFSLLRNNFVRRNSAVPTIAVTDPFDAAETLERIQTHMHSWIAMQLLDSAFSTQLDRYFQSAADAYRLNQPKVGKKHIQTMRAMIKKEQPDADKEEADDEDEAHDSNERALIDKLAARVLDFDLKYVTKRMGGDD